MKNYLLFLLDNNPWCYHYEYCYFACYQTDFKANKTEKLVKDIKNMCVFVW